MAILRAENLRFAYQPGREVLHGIDLEVEKGEVLCLLGPSGAGKTTLLRLINLLCKPQAGEIRFDGRERLNSRKDELCLRRRMAMVFQEVALFNTTVWGNVTYGLLARMGPTRRLRERWASLVDEHSELDQRVREALRTVGLAGFERRRAISLSAGEQRRVALARALVIEPELLLLDEPTANLDPRNTAVIESLVKKSNRAGTTIILATHDLSQARRLGDRVALLLGGQIIEEGPAERFFTAPEDRRTRAFIRGELVY